jgi:hypothetical protein
VPLQLPLQIIFLCFLKVQKKRKRKEKKKKEIEGEVKESTIKTIQRSSTAAIH